MNLHKTPDFDLYEGDCKTVIPQLPLSSVNAVVTSPPYFRLRSYLPDDHPLKSQEIGREGSVASYIETLVEVFRLLRPILRDDALLCINLGDTYNGSGGQGGGCDITRRRAGRTNIPAISRKSLIGIPERFMIAMIDSGWVLRNKVVWHKPNTLPRPADDRCTEDWEPVYIFAKHPEHYFDWRSIAEPPMVGSKGSSFHRGKTAVSEGKVGLKDVRPADPELKRPRSVWSIPVGQNTTDHEAPMCEELAKRLVLMSCPQGGTVLDPFAGSGTTLLVAKGLGRKGVGIELSDRNCKIILDRCRQISIWSVL